MMKKIILSTAFVLATLALSAQHKLTVVIDGIEQVKGQLFVAVYDEANYMKKFAYGKIVKVEAQEMTVVIDSIASGNYAVSLFHDVNGNNKLDMGAFGPTEPYANSNNAKGEFGPPTFKDCMIKVEDDTVTYITMK